MNVKPQREGFVEDEPVDAGASTGPVIDAEPISDLPAESDLPEWPLTISLLHKPLEIKKGAPPVKELIFREPTAGDIIRAGGNPCKVEIVEMGGGRVTWQPVIDDTKMIRLMASLCGVLEPMLQRMDPRDYASCAHRLRRFFLPEQGIW